MDTLCRKILWLVLFSFLSQGVEAQERVSKKISKKYAMSNWGELQLNNKYGDINLFGWDKDEVTIDITITVRHKKNEGAKELLKRIQPVFKEGDDFVSASYQILEKNSSFFSKLFEEANPFDMNRSNIQIDYEVYMPEKADLNIINMFGDVILDNWKGNLKATIEHGDLFINQDLNRGNITMKYGRLRAKNIDNASVNLKNGVLDMSNSKNLRITSSGSDISLKDIKSLEAYSNKDGITVERVGSIYGKFKFTSIELTKLEKNVDINLRVADFRVFEITNANVDIVIAQESSEISLNIFNFPHHFSATLEEGLVRMPKTFYNIDSEILDKGKKLRVIKASYGDNIQGAISITGKKGVILLKEV